MRKNEIKEILESHSFLKDYISNKMLDNIINSIIDNDFDNIKAKLENIAKEYIMEKTPLHFNNMLQFIKKYDYIMDNVIKDNINISDLLITLIPIYIKDTLYNEIDDIIDNLKELLK